MSTLSTSMGYGVFTTISVTGCWDGASSVRRCRSPGYRWVLDRGPSDIDIAECARPRAELSDWADERSQLPIDPEWGPGWRLGVLPLTDGSTAISLVLSHYLIDGLGLTVALVDAVLAATCAILATHRRVHALDCARWYRMPARQRGTHLRLPGRLSRWQNWPENQAGRRMMLPDHRHRDPSPSVEATAMTLSSCRLSRSTSTSMIGMPVRRLLAERVNTLLAGLAAKLGERMGRRRASDGAVTLQLPMSERTESDTRAIAMSFASVSVDPTRVTTDLRDARAAIKQALRTLRETPDQDSAAARLADPVQRRSGH